MARDGGDIAPKAENPARRDGNLARSGRKLARRIGKIARKIGRLARREAKIARQIRWKKRISEDQDAVRLCCAALAACRTDLRPQRRLIRITAAGDLKIPSYFIRNGIREMFFSAM